jgi:hypothetical protein
MFSAVWAPREDDTPDFGAVSVVESAVREVGRVSGGFVEVLCEEG